MKPRTFSLRLRITNDAGATSYYSVRPVLPDVGGPVVAFNLAKLAGPSSPVYLVAVEIGGMASCDCPQHDKAGKCKHVDSMMAAGVLPSALLAALVNRSKLLDEAQAMLQQTEEKLEKAEADLAAVSARAVLLQQEVAAYHARKPQPRRRPAKKEAA